VGQVTAVMQSEAQHISLEEYRRSIIDIASFVTHVAARLISEFVLGD
jgi:hypothetical protein